MERLAAYRRCVQRVVAGWAAFQATRSQRLRQGLFGAPAEKVAENIVEDLFTTVLDWSREGVNPQIGRADFVLSDLGIKHVVVEVKRPGSLVWHRRAVDDALCQARRYALEQKVGVVAVSDGCLLYAADLVGDGERDGPKRLRDRVLVDLTATRAPAELWWVSRHGVYRPCPLPVTPLLRPSPREGGGAAPADETAGLCHPKYRLPGHCFAYVGAVDDPRTWKLPYLLLDGTPDQRRLPKAIQAILSNYRGARVTIPRECVGDVLVQLCRTSASLGKMPCQTAAAAPAYSEAHAAVDQLGRLGEVGCCSFTQTPSSLRLSV